MRRSAQIVFTERRKFSRHSLVSLYRANQWSSAEKPLLLKKGLAASHAIVSAWQGNRLVGLANTLSDGHLVVYYSHMLVHPEFQGQGIGTQLMLRLMEKYQRFHQHILVADGRAIEFYKKFGFKRAGKTEPMWIYSGHDH